MGEITPPPGITEQQLLDRFRALQGNVTASEDDMFALVMGGKVTFVTPTPITTSTLLTSYPASAAQLGKYARVSDLWGSVSTVLVCEADQLGGFYWRPQRPDFPQNLTVSQGAVTLIPLVTAPVLNFVGTITGNVNVTPSMQNVWPGALFTVNVRSTIPALTTVSLTGLVGGGTLPLLQGSAKTIRYNPASGWQGD